MGIGIIVHGGAGNIPAELHPGFATGCRAAAETGWSVLDAGGTALDAVETAIRILEDDPIFDAGRGAHLNRDGEVELDAGIMDGRSLMAGGVAAVRRIANPISLARRVLTESEHVLLAGVGAERFAEEVGIALCDPRDLIVARERIAWEKRRDQLVIQEGLNERPTDSGSRLATGHSPAGTVGAAALDMVGNLAVGNSTGGTFFKHPGRVGDTPIIGCGLYADNDHGAAVCTGVGEQIMRIVLAKSTVDLMGLMGDATAAVDRALAKFRLRIGGEGGVICLSPQGQVGWAFSTPHMAYAYRTDGMDAAAATLGVRETTAFGAVRRP